MGKGARSAESHTPWSRTRNAFSYPPAAKKTENDEQAAVAAQAKSLEGNWSRDAVSGGGDRAHYTLSIRHGVDDVWRIDATEYPKEGGLRDLQVVGSDLRFKSDDKVATQDGLYTCATYEVRGSVSANGNTLTLVKALLPFALDRSRHWCPSTSKTFYTGQHLVEYTRQQ
jgi:hypothetical protein